MGTSSWSPDAWADHSRAVHTKPAAAIFTEDAMVASLDPKHFTIRESRDSDAHPNSTPIMLFVDVTGSMGRLSETLIKTGIGIVANELIERKPVSDPHIMVGAIGDAQCGDTAPLQATQFETDMKIAEQVKQIYVESGGGPNGYESYELPYYLAAFRVRHDAFEKRGKKGYLFTIGDEPPSPGAIASQIEKFTGDRIQADIPFADLIEMASKTFHCYHLIVAEGRHIQARGLTSTLKPWTELLGQHAIVLTAIDSMAETIVSIIQVNEGATVEEVVGSWKGDTAVAVRSAVSGLVKTGAATSTGVVEL